MDFPMLVAWACQQGASDIHLGSDGVWLRIHGQLKTFTDKVFDVSALLHLLNSQQKTQLQNKHSVDLGLSVEKGMRIRLNMFYQNQGLSAAIRIIPNDIPPLTALPAPAVFKEWMHETQGLLLITGPTGSGKTTTLASFILEINQHLSKHIVTLEDPIEFQHISQKSLITQRERYSHFVDYAEALRSTLREDPDIILIGELRDPETIQMALTAAETGHLVLGTLHTRTAASTVNRIIDVFPNAQQSYIRSQLAESLLAFVNQRLVINEKGNRQATFEVLRATAAVRQHIRDHNTSQLVTAMQTGVAYGMQAFENSQGFL
jgi:twitching motility protein PilT